MTPTARRARIALLFLFLPVTATAVQAAGEGGESRFLSNTRQLIYNGVRSGEGYFSDDGMHMIFQAEREKENPFYQIYLLDLEEGESHRVSPGTGKTTCSFIRPGCDEVLFASTHLDPDAVKKQKEELDFRASGQKRRYSWDYDPAMEIFAARRDGSELTRLTNSPGYDAEAGYSPDGNLIVFCSLRSGYRDEGMTEEEKERVRIDPSWFGEIYIMNADGSKQTRLTESPGYDGGPFFTPDGERIVWRRFDESGMLADIYTMKLDGTDVRRLTDFESMSWAPYFHPSGEYVIFASNKLGFSNFELYMTDALGSREPVRVTWTDKFDGLPVFSPDGERLAWTTSRAAEGKTHIFIARWNHEAALEAIREAPRRVQPTATEDASPGRTTGAASSGEVEASYTAAVTAGGDEGVFLPEISAADMKTQVEYLADGEREGRLTGSEGAFASAQYIARYFQEIGLEPMQGSSNYFREFPFTSGAKILPEETALLISGLGSPEGEVFDLDVHFRPLPFSKSGGAEGDLVFAGYGIELSGGGIDPYDSYADLDVKDKVVVVLRYLPQQVTAERRRELRFGAGVRTKAHAAAERGAAAMLIVAGPHSRGGGELIPFDFDRNYADTGIPVATISEDLADRIFNAAGKNLSRVQIALDEENPHAETTFPLEPVSARIYTGVDREKSSCRNVVGVLPAAAPDPIDEYVMLGAHYDHIGHGEISSFARAGEEGKVHHGADDNASGTSTVLELAAALAAQSAEKPEKFRRAIVFSLWSGEEIGLLGSTHFSEDPAVPLDRIAAYVNFDMVGRLRDNRLIVFGVGSSDLWPALLERKNVSAGFQLDIQREPMRNTDVTPFYNSELPVLSFFTGVHEEYNRPADSAATLDYDGMMRIGTFAKRIAVDLVSGERPRFVKPDKPETQTATGSGDRPYLGTIPDYTGGDNSGLLLSGVREGGPAEKGGLRGGDIVIGFAGSDISNIRDFASMLDVVKIGEPVEVKVLRDGEERTFTVVPEVRK